ncbi:MAG: hypothetical protein JXA46_08380 [Dehalococcoidales bacterium]|nr:hypothetical protein [Dehalococcoidales bacterium]
MKNSLIKILGIVLALALLSGLIMAVPVSVSAAKLSWSNVNAPDVTVGTNANVYCIAADGQTMWLYTDGAVDDDNYIDVNADPDIVDMELQMVDELYKSTNAGISWSKVEQEDLAGVELTQIVVSQFDAEQLLATDGNNVWYSEDGGDQWDLAGNPDLDKVYDIDITEDEDGDPAYLVASEEGLAIYDGAVFRRGWKDTKDSDELKTNWTSTDKVIAAAFSPSYSDDFTVVAVVAGTDYVTAKTVLVSDDADWEADVAPAEISTTATAQSACIAFPSNYNYASSSSNKFWVGLGGNDLNGLYYVNGRSSTSRVYEQIDFNIATMSYKGTYSSGTLAMGLYESTDVIISKNAASTSSFDFMESAEYKSPTGNLDISSSDGESYTLVAFSPTEDALFAGTGAEASGLFVATDEDYCIFNGISFIEVASFDSTVLKGRNGFGGETQYQVMTDGKMSIVFKSTDSGATWMEVFNTLSYGAFYDNDFDTDAQYESIHIMVLSTASDGTVYLQMNANPNPGPPANFRKFARSYDGGDTWGVFSSPGNVDISSISAVDATTYWFGSTKGVRRSDSATYAELDGVAPAVLISIPGFFVVVVGDGTIYVSTDMGESFNRLGDAGYFGGMPTFTFDVPTKTVYAVDQGNIAKWVVGESLSWTVALNKSELPEGLTDGVADENYNGEADNTETTVVGVKSIGIGPGGVWYITSSGNVNGQIWRSTSLDNDKFEAVMSTEPIDFKGKIDIIPPLGTMTDADGNTVLSTTVKRSALMVTPNYYPYQMISFIDTVLPPLKTVAPTAGTTVGATVNTAFGIAASVDFSWEGIASSYKNAEYQFQVSYDAGFGDIAYDIHSVYLDIEEIKGTSRTAVMLSPGKTYYWRVRVIYPMASKWSEPISFSTLLASDVNEGITAESRLNPANGASNVSTKPAITWGAVNGASSYDFKLATDAAISQVVEEKSGLTTTAFSPTNALKENTTYFWAVRAVRGTAADKWIVSAFTTGSTAAAPSQQGPAPQVTVAPVVTAPAPIITVAPPAVTVNPPAVTVEGAEAPGTPAYIWVIIAIGAILVIAVIVLIARTRRV